jgi:hypothetical protein
VVKNGHAASKNPITINEILTKNTSTNPKKKKNPQKNKVQDVLGRKKL